MKIDHSKTSWKSSKNRMVLSNPTKPYAKASDEQVEKGHSRRKLEELKDQKDLESYVRDIWDEEINS